jgi:drug/metabolite transporter (DMT)-like permease
MTFQQKNITASLISFTLILGFYLIRLFQMVQGESFNETTLFRTWGIVIGLAIIVTILGTILTHILSTIVQVVQTGDENPKIEDVEDERDKLIDLRGTRVTYIVFSLGVFIAMLTFVLGQPPLVMFSLLIFTGIFAQIVGDISRLYLYRRGF